MIFSMLASFWLAQEGRCIMYKAVTTTVREDATTTTANS
jgi:hypothetical protein